MPKRKPASADTHPAPASKRHACEPFRDDELSILQQTKPFQLATAKLPLDVLDCQWREGTNRQLKLKQVAHLCYLFRTNSLLRTADENFLLVKGSRAAVDNMLRHRAAQGGQSAADNTSIPFFREWSHVNPNEPLEVMAGQHRIAALKRYVQQTGAGEEQLWWTCVILDQETLPLDLDVKLRANRPGTTLCDGHAQIWSQLVLAEALARKRNTTLFRGNKEIIKKRLIDILQLGTEKLPVGRLITLWRNDRWRPILTRWSETAVGAAHFNLSTFEWMASLRIDGYWIAHLEDTLHTLEGLPGHVSKLVSADDWRLLESEAYLGSEKQVREDLFFPPHSNGAVGTRRPGFLERIPDDLYEAIAEHVIVDSSLEMPDVASLLMTSKAEGNIMAKVVGHVVDWLNNEPTVIFHRQENNKAQLRDDFMPVFLRRAQRRHVESAHLHDAAADDCRFLEKSIIDAVRDGDNMAFFTSREGASTLERRYREDEDGYGARFAHKAWAAVLSAVESVFEHDSPLPWKASAAGASVDAKERGLRTMEQSIQQAIRANEWVAGHATLGGKEALQRLSADISETIRRWVLHTEAKEHGGAESTLHACSCADGLSSSQGGPRGRIGPGEGYDDGLLDGVEWTPSPSPHHHHSNTVGRAAERGDPPLVQAVPPSASRLQEHPSGAERRQLRSSSQASTPTPREAHTPAIVGNPRSALPMSKPVQPRQQSTPSSQPPSQLAWATGRIAGSARRRLP